SATDDYVFLLSIDEAEQYFSSDSDRVAKKSDGGADGWWLRSPGNNSNNAANVNNDGNVNTNGNNVNNNNGVRPALLAIRNLTLSWAVSMRSKGAGFLSAPATGKSTAAEARTRSDGKLSTTK
ncbi:MAG: DUF6273 domain-containing protein, partial [Coriobacteriales bacterium]|nr:DUF6273 domain-containing protein [Coriobacteriales bacterium]